MVQRGEPPWPQKFNSRNHRWREADLVCILGPASEALAAPPRFAA
jgi:hypothetical protein